ncbi:response regulator [Ramlibacter albus]|uniref:Response regulator n=1 Tax=Ramlibacter albus TaxID=2079448 RepID=A0A923MED9_9BURK|nr:response regulator [Ramlibacter albus]MBC5768041.1 response regulator [Ramlibacter albus]
MALKVLIVDDAVVDRQNLERIVSGAGHRVVCAESGEQAVASARSERPDLILMDVNMPDLDGFAATRQLKSDAATRDIPVVFVTGKNQKADIAWGRMLGARGYIGKPYSAEQILAQLAAA